MADNGVAPPLNFAVKLSFGIGQIAEGIKTCAFGTFLLFYYNQILGLSTELIDLVTKDLKADQAPHLSAVEEVPGEGWRAAL